jgi:hypothetical protein
MGEPVSAPRLPESPTKVLTPGTKLPGDADVRSSHRGPLHAKELIAPSHSRS